MSGISQFISINSANKRRQTHLKHCQSHDAVQC